MAENQRIQPGTTPEQTPVQPRNSRSGGFEVIYSRESDRLVAERMAANQQGAKQAAERKPARVRSAGLNAEAEAEVRRVMLVLGRGDLASLARKLGGVGSQLSGFVQDPGSASRGYVADPREIDRAYQVVDAVMALSDVFARRMIWARAVGVSWAEIGRRDDQRRSRDALFSVYCRALDQVGVSLRLKKN